MAKGGRRMKDMEFISNYKKEKLVEFRQLPMPSWKRINIGEITIPEYREYKRPFMEVENQLPEGIQFKSTLQEDNWKDFTEYFTIDHSFGVADKLVTMGEVLNNAGFMIRASKNTKYREVIKIGYLMDEENPFLIDHNIIVAEENSDITLVIDYATSIDHEIDVIHNGVTKIFAKDGSTINLIKIQRLHQRVKNFDSNIAIVGRGAQVNYTLVNIGGDVTAINYTNQLEGAESQSNLKSIYFADGDSRMDLSYTMNHRGMRSLSKIEARGALKDRAKKVFRGNLDFKKGSRRSKGDEAEYVLLLNKEVKSHSIPVLFSHEDDVEGNHAASAGQIDDKRLFYLMSRGFSEKEAKKLIVEASFKQILSGIPLAELRDSIDEEIHRRLVYE